MPQKTTCGWRGIEKPQRGHHAVQHRPEQLPAGHVSIKFPCLKQAYGFITIGYIHWSLCPNFPDVPCHSFYPDPAQIFLKLQFNITDNEGSFRNLLPGIQIGRACLVEKRTHAYGLFLQRETVKKGVVFHCRVVFDPESSTRPGTRTNSSLMQICFSQFQGKDSRKIFPPEIPHCCLWQNRLGNPRKAHLFPCWRTRHEDHEQIGNHTLQFRQRVPA